MTTSPSTDPEVVRQQLRELRKTLEAVKESIPPAYFRKYVQKFEESLAQMESRSLEKHNDPQWSLTATSLGCRWVPTTGDRVCRGGAAAECL